MSAKSKRFPALVGRMYQSQSFKCNQCEDLKFDPLKHCSECEESYCDNCIEKGLCVQCKGEE